MTRTPSRTIFSMLCSALVSILLAGCGPFVILSNSLSPASSTPGSGSSGSSGGGSEGTGSGSSPNDPPDPTGPGIFNVRLSPYNATGDGVHDDTVGIRSAITAACSAGGGEVYFPKGTYLVSPQRSHEQGALIVACDNITLAGSGIGASIISRKTIGDTDPDAVCPLDSGQVNRGSGVYVTAKTDGDHARHSFHMTGLSLLGNRRKYTGMTGANTWPATPDNCYNVWDISDKGVYVQQDHDATDIQLNNVEVAYFSAELLYGGSWASSGWAVMNSNLHHSNGDAISVTAGIDIESNSLHDLGATGIENQPYGASEPQTIQGNQLFNIALDGVYVGTYAEPFYNAPVPAIDVGFNILTNVRRFGLELVTRGGNIHDNQIYDSGVTMWTGCGIGLIGQGGANGFVAVPRNITVTNNTVQARNTIVQCGIELYGAATASASGYNITITNNTIGPSRTKQNANGIYMTTPMYIQDGVQGLTLKNNIIQ